MRLLAIMASPRENGNSARLLRAFLEGFSSADSETRIFSIPFLDVAPCRECLSCSQTGSCVIEDDLRKFELYSDWSDALVVSSPIFFYGLPAQFKALIDRSQAAWYRRQDQGEVAGSPRPAWALLSGATKGRKLFDGALLTLSYFLRVHGFSLVGRNLLRLDENEEGTQISPEQRQAVRSSGRLLKEGGFS